MLDYAPDPEPVLIPVWTYEQFEQQAAPEWWAETVAELLPPFQSPGHGPAWEPCFEGTARIRTWKLAPDRGWMVQVDCLDGDVMLGWVPTAMEFVGMMALA